MVIAGNRERLGVVPEGSPLLLGLSSWGMECPVGLSVARAWFPILPGCLRGAEQQKSRRLRAHPCLRLPLAAAPSSTLPAPGEWSRGWAARCSPPSSLAAHGSSGGRAVAPSSWPAQSPLRPGLSVSSGLAWAGCRVSAVSWGPSHGPDAGKDADWK